jgi:molybdopterin-guanine dinucleotide biosynthesis protein A
MLNISLPFQMLTDHRQPDKTGHMGMEVTCAILSGGMSRRIGRDKATLQIGGETLIRHVYHVAKRVFSRIIVVSSHHEDFHEVDAPIVADILPLHGSLTGIVSALIHASMTHTEP